MDVVGQILDSGEPPVGQDTPALVARGPAHDRVVGIELFHPAVIDIDVLPAVVDQSAGDHRLCRLADLLLVDGTAPAVPTVPAHRRSQRDRVSHDQTQRTTGLPQVVAGDQRDLVFTPAVETPGDSACLGADGEPVGQALCVEPHGSLSRRRDGIEHGRPRSDAEHLGAVDPWFGARFGCQDDRLFPGGVHRLRPLADDREGRVCPVGVVVVDSIVAPTDEQDELIDAGHVDVHFAGGLSGAQDAALVDLFAVGQDTKLHRPELPGFVVQTHPCGKARAAARQIDVQGAVGVGAQTPIEGFAIDAEGVAVHGFVLLRRPPALLGLTDVQVGKPDLPAPGGGFGGSRPSAGNEAQAQQDGYIAELHGGSFQNHASDEDPQNTGGPGGHQAFFASGCHAPAGWAARMFPDGGFSRVVVIRPLRNADEPVVQR